MRPNSHEVLQGVISMLEAEVIPILAKSGQTGALGQLGLGAVILRLVASRWDNEGKMLYDGNKELRQELGNSAPVLAGAGLSELVKEIESCLRKRYVSDGDYPTLQALTEESCDLKEVLERILVAMAHVKETDTSLAAIHTRLRSMMRRHTERDLAASEQAMRTFAPSK